MKIKKIKVSNFRNLKNIDIEFWNINILTWKNSTWKTNLTQLLYNCLNTNENVKDYFWDNIVTVWQWLNYTNLEVTIWDINYLTQIKSLSKLSIYSPKEITYKQKTLSSKEQSLDYIWWELIKDWNSDNLNFLDYKDILVWNIQLDKIDKKNIFKKRFEGMDNIDLGNSNSEYYSIFKSIVGKNVINYDNRSSFSACLGIMYDFIVKKYKSEKYKSIINKLNSKEIFAWSQNFIEADFIDILSDIQRNEKQFKEFNKDVSFFTDWIISKVEINTKWASWFKWDIFIKTPFWPKDIEYISSWSAIILYFVALRHWLELDSHLSSFKKPYIMIFDELDSAIHPWLLWRFTELLNIISNKIQLFITTHSPLFIDNFEKKDIYLLKDIWSFEKNIKLDSNIFSYQEIINKLNDDEKKIFMETSNSDLYINWYMEWIYPVSWKEWTKK